MECGATGNLGHLVLETVVKDSEIGQGHATTLHQLTMEETVLVKAMRRSVVDILDLVSVARYLWYICSFLCLCFKLVSM